MAIVPDLQVLYRRKDDILFGWQPLKKSEAKYYNLYSSSTSGGAYTIVKTKIPNEVDKSVYRGKVVCIVKDADIPIPENKNVPPEQGGVVVGVNYWFKLTFVDQSDVESNLASSDAIVVRPHYVEPFFENEDEVKNNHNMLWIPERHRWEKMLGDPDGKLKVDAEINVEEITLGDVKVAARDDNTTLEYLLVDNNRRLIVRPDPNGITRISDYKETTVVPNTETTILTFTNGLDYFIEKIVCSGTSDGVFKLKIDGSTKRTLRNSWNDRNVTFDYSTIARKISTSSTTTITVEHSEIRNQDFESSLEGFTYTLN